jgi:hypothetical protein
MWGTATARGDAPVPSTNERSGATKANVVRLAPTICFSASILGFSDAAPDEIAMREDETATPGPKVFPRARLCKGTRYDRL